MDLFDTLESARERWNLLEHPFYQRWTSGELTPADLALYAAEYRHAVVALAELADATARAAPEGARAGLEQHAAEEAAHVELWDDFAAAVGAEAGGEPRPETAECVAAWTAAKDAREGLATLYAIEAGQPTLAEIKLAGLVEHYGLPAEGPATAYFALHAELDSAHAAHSRALLEAEDEEADPDRLGGVAEAALRGNWGLLDGVARR